MGNDQSLRNEQSMRKNVQRKHFKNSNKRSQMAQNVSCIDDLQCQNINSSKSVPGQPPVLVCPSAKCVMGSCECGTECKKDPYMGFCCKDVQVVKTVNGQGSESVDTFCIENFANAWNGSGVCKSDYSKF